MIGLEVIGNERLSPSFARLTLGGADLAHLEDSGFDQCVRLFFPRPGQPGLRLPTLDNDAWLAQVLLQPKARRPFVRNYTVRAFRPDELELDIDFVCHGTAGVAGPWAESVEPGTEVAFIDQGCGWAPVPADWSLLVADESGLPAVLGILRDLPRDAVGHAIVELIDAADAQDVDAPAGMTLHWVSRAEGGTALDRLRSLDWPAGTPYAFAVGESKIATGARRYLVGERGVPKGNVTFCGYWKAGKA